MRLYGFVPLEKKILILMIFVTYRVDQEIADRNGAESALTTRIDKEIVDREDAISEIKSR